MPEGHTIHRLARQHRRDLGGGPLAVSSPQGRASGVAARLNGERIVQYDAYGKHLLYRWSTGDTLHIHLGLYGRFRKRPSPPSEPRGQIRLRLVGERSSADLSGAIACELLDPAEQERLLARLGPDPLRADGDLDRFAALLRRRRIPIGAALMDQSVIAGIGNVYRAELLNCLGIDPRRSARELEPELVRSLWEESARLLTAGVRSGRIVTRPKPAGVRRQRRADALWVYRRTACARCEGPVERFELAARTMYSCPTCQPGLVA